MNYGICVPKQFSSSIESFCENKGIQLTYWAGLFESSVSGDVEYHLKSEKDRNTVGEFLERLKKLG